MTSNLHCTKWGVWSYKLHLKKPLAVLGHSPLIRKGWIVGQCFEGQWKFGEVAPLPTFHNLSYEDVFNDLTSVFVGQYPPSTALVQTVFDVWNVPLQEGFVSINSLLGAPDDPPPSSSVVKIKLGRRPLNEEISWFTQLQQVHPMIKWRIDCNRQWSLEELNTFWQYCHQDAIEYFEEPLENPHDLEQCESIPIALDESLNEYPYLLNLPNVIAMVIKPTLHLNWKEMLQDNPSKRAIFSSTFEGSLGLWGLGQLALQYAHSCTHGLGTLGWFKEECVHPPLAYSHDHLRIERSPTPVWKILKLEMGE